MSWLCCIHHCPWPCGNKQDGSWMASTPPLWLGVLVLLSRFEESTSYIAWRQHWATVTFPGLFTWGDCLDMLLRAFGVMDGLCFLHCIILCMSPTHADIYHEWDLVGCSCCNSLVSTLTCPCLVLKPCALVMSCHGEIVAKVQLSLVIFIGLRSNSTMVKFGGVFLLLLYGCYRHYGTGSCWGGYLLH